MRILALHGLPTSPRLFERLVFPVDWSVEAPSVPGLGDDGTPGDWTLASCVRALQPLARDADILIGHDLGGVLAAMLAQPGQSIVLSGTALGAYWLPINATALPGLERFFYRRHAGRRFLSRGGLPEHASSLLEAFGDHGPDWAARMRLIAWRMRPPIFTAVRLRACGVRLAWGRKDPWYPKWVAHTLQRTTGGHLSWLDSGHFAPWEDPKGFAAIVTGAALVG